MKHFSRMTKKTEDPKKKNAVIMGRKTWESIPPKFRPLPGRLNIVVSSHAVSDPLNFPGCTPCGSFSSGVEAAETESDDIECVWVIGGASIYKAALDSGLVNRIYLTRILKHFECDVFMPEMSLHKFKLIQDPLVPTEEQIEGEVPYKYEVYERTEP